MKGFYYKPLQHRQIRIGPYTTSKIEIVDLIKSWIAISLAISFINFVPGMALSFFERIIFAGITVGTAFLFHEIGHKIAAQRYGCFAEFRSSDSMLIMALIIAALFKFVFFAPGAVVIAGPVGRRRNGIISLAGPGVNFALAILFLMGMLYVNGAMLITLFTFGYIVNTWIGLFNMIPFGMFDGKKILRWSKPIYYGMVVLGFVLLLSKEIIQRLII